MIEIKNLDFSYRQIPVFHDISTTFREGCIYGLLGENGVGKTTLLKIISGLLPPSAGTCTVDGLCSFDRNPEMLQQLVFLPDEVILPDMATPESYVLECAPFYPRFDESLFRRLMRELEVDEKRRFKEMSAGQRKKSMIAAILSLGTKYVLLDEPTNGLDIPSKSEFRRIVSSFLREDVTIIISTHQVKDVENLIDPILILSKEEVLLDAGMAEISRKISFTCDAERDESALYSEQVPGGWLQVRPNSGGEETPVNIEALFNAVLKNKHVVKQLFEQKGGNDEQ